MDNIVETEELGNCLTRLSISIPYEKVKAEIDRAFAEVSGSLAVPGFRPGKAPRQLVERRYGKVLREEALNKLLPTAYREAVVSSELHPVMEPKFDNVKYEKEEPLTFTATVEVMPDFALPDNGKIEIKKVEVKEPDEKEVQEVLNMHREYHAKYEPVEGRVVEAGDFVLVNIEQEMDGKKDLEKGRMLEVNKEKLLPGFAEQLVEMKPGDKKKFDVTVPEDYSSKEIAGKSPAFEVELLEIKKKVLPELDDDFAKDTGRAETLEGLKEDIRRVLMKNKEEKARSDEENQIIEALLDMTDFEAPPSLVKVQAQSNVRRTLQYSMYSGVSREEVMEQKDEIYERASESSVRQIKLFFLLQKIGEAENIAVEEREIDERIEEMALGRQEDPKELRKRLEESDEVDSISNRVMRDKVIRFLHDKARKN